MKRLTELVFPPPPDSKVSLGLLLIRIVGGWAFVLHGWNKIQNPFGWMGESSTMPAVLQALAAISEFFGGMAWMLGLLTPLAAFGIFSTMVVVVSRALLKGDPFTGKGSYELALIYALISILLIVSGPGRFALDAWVLRRIKSRDR